jgi:hypothetical protein
MRQADIPETTAFVDALVHELEAGRVSRPPAPRRAAPAVITSLPLSFSPSL